MDRNSFLVEHSKLQEDMRKMQLRHTPYFVITVFSIGVAFIRYYMIPEWPMYFHVALFFLQVFMLSCIWRFVMDLNDRLEKTFPFRKGVAKRMIMQIGLTFLAILPVIAIISYFVTPYIPSFVNKQFMVISIMLFMLLIILFNFAFYAFYFFGNWQQSVEEKARLEVQAAELEKEKFNLQYHQLRNQVNPHYLFNMLSSLDGLIHTKPDLASEFVRHMSKVYRYVLQHKESEVVSVYKELDFIQHYIELMNIRYADGINIQCNVSADASERGIVMVTLQMLIDNATKHNSIQADIPLNITIKDEGDYLVVSNNKQLRKQIETSNRQGIKQLQQLYAYHTDKQLLIENDNEHYTIKIPLL